MRERLHELKIELTQECPLACIHCSTNSSRKQRSSLPEAVVLRLLREGAELGVRKVVLTGGEPLVSATLPKAVQLARSLGIAVTVYTTGIVDNSLTPMPASLAVSLAALGLNRFIFSIYSDRADVHESITRYGTHRATLSAIRTAIATGLPVEMHFVAMQRNFRDLPGVVNLAESLGVETLSVLRFVPQGRGRTIAGRDDLSQEDFRSLAETIIRLRTEHPSLVIRAGSPLNILGIGHTPCNAAQDVLVINHRGDIFPCDAFKNVRFLDDRWGSVLYSSLTEVWRQSLFLNKVRQVLAAEKGSTCQSCSWSRSCQSGCLAQKVVREGWESTDQPDPACLLAGEARHKPALVQIAGIA